MCRDCTEAVREIAALERAVAAGVVDLEGDEDNYDDLLPVSVLSHRPTYI